MSRFKRLAPLAGLLLLAGCADNNELSIDTVGVGQRIERSRCPAAAIPTYTGDVTLFDPADSRAASAIDVVATITDLRLQCDDNATGAQIASTAGFTVRGRRSGTSGARDVALPYFATVIRGGTVVESKQLGQVTLHFADGQPLAVATASASAMIDRAAATLPATVREKLTRKRKPTDADASIDPMSDTGVRAAVAKASFEVLVGFQLTDAQLRYNATR